MTNAPRSDALAFFGATGDLAYKKIFPALHAMARRGHLEFPVIGVAKPATPTNCSRQCVFSSAGTSRKPRDSSSRRYTA